MWIYRIEGQPGFYRATGMTGYSLLAWETDARQARYFSPVSDIDTLYSEWQFTQGKRAKQEIDRLSMILRGIDEER